MQVDSLSELDLGDISPKGVTLGDSHTSCVVASIRCLMVLLLALMQVASVVATVRHCDRCLALWLWHAAGVWINAS